jgi:hypothetical protein
MARDRRSRRSRSASRRHDTAPHSGDDHRESRNLNQQISSLRKQVSDLNRDRDRHGAGSGPRSGPVWPCACGFRTNFADRTHCHGCKCLRGNGKAPAPQCPSQHVKQSAPAQAAAAVIGTAAAQGIATPATTLESQRKAVCDRIVLLRANAAAQPADGHWAQEIARHETELSVIKDQIFALKPAAAKLQTALAQKSAVDRKIVTAQAQVQATLTLLQEQQAQLVAFLEQQAALDLELIKLKTDGMGLPPAPPPVNPQDLLTFMRAFMATCAPNVAVDLDAVEKLGQQMGFFPPADVAMPGPDGAGTDPAADPAPIPAPAPTMAAAAMEVPDSPDGARTRSRSPGRTPPACRPAPTGTLNHWIKGPPASAPSPAETAAAAAAAVAAASSSSL